MKKNFWNWLLLIIIFGAFWFKGYTTLDPDFGWHLKMGELIVKSGIPKTDPFSYTMPTYPFVDFHWLTNVGMYLGYQQWGMSGLAAIFAFMAILVFVVLFVKKNLKWAGVPMFLGMAVLLQRSGVRPQVEDWLFLAVILRLLEKKVWEKWKWVFPIIMAVSANLHGGFLVGLVVVGLATGDLVVLILGVAATLINPYEVRLWHAVWTLLSDSLTKQYIAEWRPFYTTVNLGFWALFVFTAGLGWRYKNKIELWKWVGFFGLFVSSLVSLRNMTLFAVIAMPILAKVLEEMNREFGKGEAGKRWGWFLKVLIGISLTLAAVDVGIGLMNYRVLSEKSFYPNKAVGWLKQQNYSGNMFTNYGWGGYLIWKWPGKKQFVDGRMPEWRQGNEDAFRDYLQITNEGKYKELFRKYNIEAVMWPKRELVQMASIWTINLPSWWPKIKKTESLIEVLEKDGWKKVYEDEVTIVMTK